MKIHIETERLILRNLTSDDWQAAFKWCGDPDVARYMVYPVYSRAEDVRTWLESLDLDDHYSCVLLCFYHPSDRQNNWKIIPNFRNYPHRNGSLSYCWSYG